MPGKIQPPTRRPRKHIKPLRAVLIEAEFRPSPQARERLIDLLVELLDAGGHLGGG